MVGKVEQGQVICRGRVEAEVGVGGKELPVGHQGNGKEVQGKGYGQSRCAPSFTAHSSLLILPAIGLIRGLFKAAVQGRTRGRRGGCQRAQRARHGPTMCTPSLPWASLGLPPNRGLAQLALQLERAQMCGQG